MTNVIKSSEINIIASQVIEKASKIQVALDSTDAIINSLNNTSNGIDEARMHETKAKYLQLRQQTLDLKIFTQCLAYDITKNKNSTFEIVKKKLKDFFSSMISAIRS